MVPMRARSERRLPMNRDSQTRIGFLSSSIFEPHCCGLDGRGTGSALDYRPKKVLIVIVKLLTVTELKAAAGKILDRARAGRPQYVVRGGDVLQITRATLIVGVEERQAGYFASDYAKTSAERLELERAMSKTSQKPER